MNHGKLRAALFIVLAGCGPNIGSRFVKSQQVNKNEAAVITVTESEEPALAGTVLDIPRDAIEQDTTVTLELGMSDVVTPADALGSVAIWEPSALHFAVPARLTLPLKKPVGSAEEVLIAVEEANGTRREIHDLTFDAAAKTVSFNIDGFTRFQPA